MNAQPDGIVESLLRRIEELEPPNAETMVVCQALWMDITLSGLNNETIHGLSNRLGDKIAEMRECHPKLFNALPIVCPQSMVQQPA